MKRFFDLIFSFFGLLILAPILLFVGIIVKLGSTGSVFYKQVRVGKNNKDFKIYKFRTMQMDAEKSGLLTIGDNDPRITKIGYFLRKYKLDEFPQLINVLLGDMSFVGPRPEVRLYVNYYNTKQKQVLNYKPGITDLASITYRNESALLAQQQNPEEFYIKNILPKKIEINLKYIKQRSFANDIKVIFKTIFFKSR